MTEKTLEEKQAEFNLEAQEFLSENFELEFSSLQAAETFYMRFSSEIHDNTAYREGYVPLEELVSEYKQNRGELGVQEDILYSCVLRLMRVWVMNIRCISR